MKRFAKLFDTTNTQILCYVDFDEVADEHILHQIGSINGTRFDVAFRWDGDDQEEKAYAALEKFDQATAERVAMDAWKLIASCRPPDSRARALTCCYDSVSTLTLRTRKG